MGWYGPQGDCENGCCGGSCIFLDYNSGVGNQRFADHFDVISGTWSDSVSTVGEISESTGSGIALAKVTTDGSGTEQYLFTSNQSSHRYFDFVFDYIDADNYQVIKAREHTFGNYHFKLARVEGGSETDLDTAPYSGGENGGDFRFVMNDSNTWVVWDSTLNFPAVFFYDHALYGGTRFGLRSNTGGNTSRRITKFACVNAVTSAVAGLAASNLPNSGTSILSDASNPFCAVNPGSTQTGVVPYASQTRCVNCIHLAPRNGEATWLLTVAGVTGSCASLFNGSFVIVPPSPSVGASGPSYYHCVADYRDDNATCSIGGDDRFLTYLVSLSGITGALANSRAIVEAALNTTLGYGPVCGFALPGTEIINCYTDWPQELERAGMATPTAEYDFTNATATLDLVY